MQVVIDNVRNVSSKGEVGELFGCVSKEYYNRCFIAVCTAKVKRFPWKPELVFC